MSLDKNKLFLLFIFSLKVVSIYFSTGKKESNVKIPNGRIASIPIRRHTSLCCGRGIEHQENRPWASLKVMIRQILPMCTLAKVFFHAGSEVRRGGGGELSGKQKQLALVRRPVFKQSSSKKKKKFNSARHLRRLFQSCTRCRPTAMSGRRAELGNLVFLNFFNNKKWFFAFLSS